MKVIMKNNQQPDEPAHMSHDLQRAGLPVIYDTGKNVGKIVIDLTKPYITNSRSTKP